MLICDSSKAGALEFARDYNIATQVVAPAQFADQRSFGKKLLDVLRECRIQWIVLAGYLKKIPQEVIASFHHRIVNIHPSLLPSFGGAGMYGMRVHQAVFERGVKLTGVTVHLVNEIYDDGPIVAQESVDISRCNSPQEIAARVLTVEHQLYPKALQKLIGGDFTVEGKRVMIRE